MRPTASHGYLRSVRGVPHRALRVTLLNDPLAGPQP